VLRILDGQTDETFALRGSFYERTAEAACEYKALVTVSNLCLVKDSSVNGDGGNSCKDVGSAGTAWKIVELLGI
jgi:hypothetical protein